MKTYLTYGAGITFACAVFTLVLHILGYLTDPEKLGTGMLVTTPCVLVITIVGIVLGTKKIREPHGAKGFTYGQAWVTGFYIATFAALTGVIFNYIYYQFINPNFNEVVAEWTRSFMERMKVPDEQIEKQMAAARAGSTVLKRAISALFGTVIMGMIISLITAAVMKRAPSDDFTTEPPPLS